MPSKLKQYMYDELRSRFEDVEHCLVVKHSGITAEEMTTLRSTVRNENGNLMVVKNSIASRAFLDLGVDEEFAELFEGPVAVAYGEDPASLARVLSDWNKKAKKLEFAGGMVGKKPIGSEGVSHLATLPPMPVMQAMAIGAIAAPLTSFMTVCKEVITSFVRVADQLAKQKGGEAAPAE